MVSDEHRLLFVHVQKTGGTTIDNRLKEVLPDARGVSGLDRHARLGEILEVEPGLADHLVVGFVRNPWARMLSWYRMVLRFEERAEKGKSGAARQLRINDFLASVSSDYGSFEEFVLRGPDDWERLRTPQVDYLTSPGRDADVIGRQESLEADLETVFERLGLPWEPLNSRNVDNHRPDYRDEFTPAGRDRVAEVFARDLEAFGYEF